MCGPQDTSLEDLRVHTLTFAKASGRTDDMTRVENVDDYVVRVLTRLQVSFPAASAR